MEKKIYSILSSSRLMAILFLGFAVAMAVGTFIESKYNTDTARILVYNSWWFEGIMLFFVINFISTPDNSFSRGQKFRPQPMPPRLEIKVELCFNQTFV